MSRLAVTALHTETVSVWELLDDAVLFSNDRDLFQVGGLRKGMHVFTRPQAPGAKASHTHLRLYGGGDATKPLGWIDGSGKRPWGRWLGSKQMQFAAESP